MKKNVGEHSYSLLSVSLRLFDGEGAGAATAAGGSRFGSGTAADPEHTPQGVRTGSGRESRNTGGAHTSAASDAGRRNAPEGDGKSEREKLAAFRALAGGEYKDQYARETQRLIDRRFRENREREEQTAPLLALLGRRYGVDPGDIGAITQAAAAEERDAGSREKTAAERELRIGRRLRQWTEEAGLLRGTYPDFDLRSEVKNPRFLALLRAGIPLETAYRALHYDELMDGVRAEAERRVTENVRARGSRPREAGAGQPGAFTVKTDVSKLTREDMEEVKRRVLRGETVSF